MQNIMAFSAFLESYPENGKNRLLCVQDYVMYKKNFACNFLKMFV